MTADQAQHAGGAPMTVPDDFIWGVATSSYQIEGGVDVDGRGPSIWDTFCRMPGKVHGGATGDVACDHYHRLEEDLDLLAWLGVGTYRFSVAWPRVMPDGRHVEPRGLDFYDRLVDGLLARGIHPMATLYHWDLPQALEDDGGWASRETAAHFGRYAQVVAERLGDRVRHWSTLNEPWCSAFLGYDTGIHAPGIRDERSAIAAVHHLLLAHARGIEVLRTEVGGDASLGIVCNLAPIRPARPGTQDEDAAAIADGLRNRIWLEPLASGRYPADVLTAWDPIIGIDTLVRDGDLSAISAPIDLLGINYYNPVYVMAGQGRRPPGPGQDGVVEVPGPSPATAMDWSIDPSGLEELLSRVARDLPGVPLALTETGGAFADVPGRDGTVQDDDRIAYLDGHLRAVGMALAAGVDVRGFFVWTLMDNFEWAEGYRYRFGIVHVDRDTLARTPKASARWYRDVISAGGAAVADPMTR